MTDVTNNTPGFGVKYQIYRIEFEIEKLEVG